MSIGMYSALSAMKMREEELDVVAHNLANVSTNGFKEMEIAFRAIKSDKGSGDNSNSTPFAEVSQRTQSFNQGAMIATSNRLDFAIQGEGFFELQGADGAYYSRDGAFTMNRDGELVNQYGDKVQGVNGTIVLGTGSRITVGENGFISVDGVEKGQMKVVDFPDKAKLKPTKHTGFLPQEGLQPQTVATPIIAQGHLEGSNVDMVRNLVKMIVLSRDYGQYQKIMGQQQQLDQQAATAVGRMS